MTVGEAEYTERQQYIKEMNMSKEEATDYLVRESLKDKYPQTLWMIRSMIAVFGLSLSEARMLIETHVHQTKLKEDLYTEEQLKQFAETQKIIDRFLNE